ncbi:hypothetical protein TWF694_000502 [Orbilia ellipsospora]|uniref:Uncharacterized protein n=1 Tax=Orbilia ellipsospora TaxID=2528407 RepID=A0AAV9XNS5_9PEZI
MSVGKRYLRTGGKFKVGMERQRQGREIARDEVTEMFKKKSTGKVKWKGKQKQKKRKK